MPDADTEPDWVIRVPVGELWLSANQRMHWAVRGSLTAVWRKSSSWCAVAAKVPALGPSRVIAELDMVPRRRTRIDPANYAPTAKAAVDGLVDAGIWPDDSAGWVTGPDMRLGAAVRALADEALVLKIWGRPCCARADCHHREATA